MRISAALLAFLGLADARKRTQSKNKRGGGGENLKEEQENFEEDDERPIEAAHDSLRR